MEICNVLVVDDESFIANSITALLQCQNQWELDVYKAYSGEEALVLMRNMRVDILITDIRMPGMDGLELCHLTQSLWPECIRILLTAYQDFSFAHKAIRDGIDSYLLKTESDESILAEFGRAISRFQKKQERFTQDLPAKKYRPDMNSEPFRILLSIPQSNDQTHAILRTMGISLFEFWILSFDLQGITDHIGTLEWMVHEQVAGRGKMIASCLLEKRLFFLLLPDAPVSSLQGALELVQQHYSSAYGSDISIVISLINEKNWNFNAEYTRIMDFFATNKEELTSYIYQMPASQQETEPIHELLNKLIKYIKDHIQEDLSLGLLSEIIGYSPTYLSKLFHEKTGQSLSAYISTMKIERIKRLMLNPDLSLNDISSTLGFSSRSYFNRYVKRMTGFNPQQLRAKAEEDQKTRAGSNDHN